MQNVTLKLIHFSYMHEKTPLIPLLFLTTRGILKPSWLLLALFNEGIHPPLSNDTKVDELLWLQQCHTSHDAGG